ANSSYIFLYDRNQSKSYVFSNEKLEYIEIKNPPESNATRAAIMGFVKSSKELFSSSGNVENMNVFK
ncbi:MAG: hypothetical protein Q8T08_20375, partial [Ignavibacteria bacterium]|nr:hypothetical protein [Ignavibacteria bacterium]